MPLLTDVCRPIIADRHISAYYIYTHILKPNGNYIYRLL